MRFIHAMHIAQLRWNNENPRPTNKREERAAAADENPRFTWERGLLVLCLVKLLLMQADAIASPNMLEAKPSVVNEL